MTLLLEVFHSHPCSIICYLLTQIPALFQDDDHTWCTQNIVCDTHFLMLASQTRLLGWSSCSHYILYRTSWRRNWENYDMLVSTWEESRFSLVLLVIYQFTVIQPSLHIRFLLTPLFKRLSIVVCQSCIQPSAQFNIWWTCFAILPYNTLKISNNRSKQSKKINHILNMFSVRDSLMKKFFSRLFRNLIRSIS